MTTTESNTEAAAGPPAQRPHNDGAAARVWRTVIRGLYTGEFRPGQRLTEIALTQRFQVSRSSVREALSRLAAEGVVTLQRHKGAVIRAVDRQEHLQTLAVLDVLIGLAARLAAANTAAGETRSLAEAELRRLAALPERFDAFEFAQERNRFYRVLLQLADNPVLQQLMQQVGTHTMRVQLAGLEHRAVVVADYIAILAAIVAGDPDRAEGAARAHVAHNVREISRTPVGG
ncbi:GntR family transcriptional regulator [Caulobacter sp. KR2-114]|uniref:GntR family transcriptional regulator n=1 Tax=Caulobacter sp. KR2-114 TaxID=3400912 RepID=UPI003C04C0C4